MARITVEDCLKKVDNRFKLIHLAAKRVRQLRKGSEPLVDSKNTDIVVSLREIAIGKVFLAEDTQDHDNLIESSLDSETEEIPKQAQEESPNDEKATQEEVEAED